MRRTRRGFTLIELSIVLVIVGLLVGGVLVGRDLINASYLRAQVSQIQQYQSAVNTFKAKFGYLPGDIPEPYASQFGFKARGQYSGQGDGNGVLEAGGPYASTTPCTSSGCGFKQCSGETGLFWVDLASQKLIEQYFGVASATEHCTPYNMTGTAVDQFFPKASLGGNRYLLVWSGGVNYATLTTAFDSTNYFGLFSITGINTSGWETVSAAPSMTVAQAHAIDTKMDDGLPTSGGAQAVFVGQPGNGSFGAGISGHAPYYNGGAAPGTSAVSSSFTCYDNGGNAANLMQYSLTQNNGSGMNCALSFKFQ